MMVINFELQDLRSYSVFFIRFFLLTLLCLSGYVHAAEDKIFLWKVTKDKQTAYLMGSVHFADSSFYPLRKEVEQAYSESSRLVVEVDISQVDEKKYHQIMVSRGVYTDGTDLKDVLTEETWLQLRQRLKNLGIRYEDVKHLKPGMLVLVLTSAHVMQMGFNPDLGIDMHFLNRANSPQGKDKAKQVVELETLEQQIQLFLNIPDADLLLKESLYSLDESELLMAEMMRYWKAGDDKNMNRLLFEDALSEYPAFTAIYDELFYKRNENMTRKIRELMKLHGTSFVVVGTGHLIGDKGIVADLKRLGYKVERM